MSLITQVLRVICKNDSAATGSPFLFAACDRPGLLRQEKPADRVPNCPGAKLLSGKVFRGAVSKADLQAWADSLQV